MTRRQHTDDGTRPPGDGSDIANTERLEILEWTMAVFAARDTVRQISDGYALGYRKSDGWDRKLPEFRVRYQATHPALRTSIVDDPEHGRIWLHIEGPRDTREYVEIALQFSARERRGWKVTARWRLRRLTAAFRVLPDFLIIGAARCGTTSLYLYLEDHPAVAPAYQKEVGFFDRNFHRGGLWYRAYFPTVLSRRLAARPGGSTVLTGESTPEYLFDPRAARRASRTVPNAKLIVLLRCPVARAYSHYQLEVRNGYEVLSFEEAVDHEETRLRGELDRMTADENYFSRSRTRYSYLARGLYLEQIRNWLQFFPRERMLILPSEVFNRERRETFRRILEFLELPSWEPQRYPSYNIVPRLEMNPATRERLQEYFAPHNRRLYEFLGQDLGWGSSGLE